MSLQQEVNDAWKTAMKARDASKDTLTAIRTELKNRAIKDRKEGDNGTEVDDDKALQVLSRMAKQRKESITEFEKGGRSDLVEKETAELKVIEGFLPAAMSTEEVAQIVSQVVEATGATSMKEMGKVMGQAMQKVGSGADGKVVQAAVKAALS